MSEALAFLDSPKPQPDWSVLRRNNDLQLEALQASFTKHAFARHWHDYYVIGLVESGAQSFWCRRDHYTTPGGGLILLNPGEAHTGEAAGADGFRYRALYPTIAHITQAQAEFRRSSGLPQFPAVRVDDAEVVQQVHAVHQAIADGAAPVECETRWLKLLTTLIGRYGDTRRELHPAGSEPQAVAKIRNYIETNYAERITLAELAQHAYISPFHLVRSFERSVGVPPHVYLDSVRIRHAQQLIADGKALADVAYAVGFSSQSHFTSRFRRIIGVTPGNYRDACARL